MTAPSAGWRATIDVTLPDPGWCRWIEQALAPEVAREVPRARARVERRGSHGLAIEIEARDAGGVRAALNTYLGWVQLSVAALRAGAAPPPAE
ncbi:MAG TPA: KEOPS complex subunit Pcc1 [Thermoplasmata archaeon]|nr:KEOPS complex subunit Pcc1 [Thermoplasmata archaeon]